MLTERIKYIQNQETVG